MNVLHSMVDELSLVVVLALAIGFGFVLAAAQGLALWIVAPPTGDREYRLAFRTAYTELFVSAGLAMLVDWLGTGSPLERAVIALLTLAIPVVVIQIAYRTTLWRSAWMAIGMRFFSGALVGVGLILASLTGSL
jgi:hypothetical protein